MCLYAYSGQGETMSMKGVSSELEDAFLDKPQTVKSESRIAPGTASGGEERSLTEGEKWQARLAAFLDIPAVPPPDGLNLKLLEAPSAKFIVAVFDTGEEHVVHRAKQIVWPRVRMLFAGGPTPFLHIVPAAGGTFSAGRAFYTIMSEKDGFSVFYIPQKSTRKVALAFSGEEGAFLTPDGFVCRIKRHTSDGGGIQ
jgi:hypothetical protein